MTKQQILKYIGILLIGLLAGIYIISAFKSTSGVDQYKHQLDSLTTVINVNNRKQLIHDIKITSFEEHINKVDSQNVVLENKIKKLNKNRDAKIKAVDNMSNDSLYNSITNRYK